MNPTICEQDPSQYGGFGDGADTRCDGPPTEMFRQHSTRVNGKVVPLDTPSAWGARCDRHGKWVDRELNESRRIV